MKLITHQFSLFEYNQIRPTRKIPISKQRIEQAKKLFNSGDYNGAAAQLRELRESLERLKAGCIKDMARFKVGQKVCCRKRGMWTFGLENVLTPPPIKDGEIVTIKWCGTARNPFLGEYVRLYEVTGKSFRADLFEPIVSDERLHEDINSECEYLKLSQ